MITLVRAVRTSVACPSQWDAWDAENNYYYLRYRSGCGSIRRYRTEKWYESSDDEFIETVADFYYGDPLDGYIEIEDFARLAGIQLADGLAEVGFWDQLADKLTLGIDQGREIHDTLEDE